MWTENEMDKNINVLCGKILCMHATVFIVMWTELNNFMFLTERTTIFKKHCVLLHDSFYDGIYWKNLYAQTLVQS